MHTGIWSKKTQIMALENKSTTNGYEMDNLGRAWKKAMLESVGGRDKSQQ